MQFFGFVPTSEMDAAVARTKAQMEEEKKKLERDSKTTIDKLRSDKDALEKARISDKEAFEIKFRATIEQCRAAVEKIQSEKVALHKARDESEAAKSNAIEQKDTLERDIQRERQEKIQEMEKKEQLDVEAKKAKEKLESELQSREQDILRAEKLLESREGPPIPIPYDFVANISSLDDLIKTGKFDVEVDPTSYKADVEKVLRKERPTLFVGKKVAVSGLFNRGKTFVLSRLADVDLPFGMFTATRGISVKRPKTATLKSILLVDTAGQYVPVDVTSGEQAWANRMGTEALIKQVLLDFVNAHIVVVNELTWPDQIYIQELQDYLKDAKGKVSEVFIVHNLKTMNIAQKNKYIDERIKPYFPRGNSTPINDTDEHKWWQDAGTNTRHIFIVNDVTTEGRNYNDIMFKKLREWLSSILAQVEETNIWDEIRESLQRHLKTYLQCKSDIELSTLSYQPAIVPGVPLAVDDEHSTDVEMKDAISQLALVNNQPDPAAVRQPVMITLALEGWTRNHHDYKIKPIELPKGLVVGIHAKQEINPPQRTLNYRDDPNGKPTKFEIVLDVPGLEPGDYMLDFEGWPDFIVSGKRVARVAAGATDAEDVKTVKTASIRYGDFSSTFRLNPKIDPNSVQHTLKNGCLHIMFKYMNMSALTSKPGPEPNKTSELYGPMSDSTSISSCQNPLAHSEAMEGRPQKKSKPSETQ